MSHRSTRPSSILIGISQSIRMPSRISLFSRYSMDSSTFGLQSIIIGAGNPQSVAVEQVDAAPVKGQREAFAGLDLGHAETFGDCDERPLDAGVEIEQRILAERFDQPYRQLDVAAAAQRDADVLGPDAERDRARFRGLEAVRQCDVERR